MAELPDTHPRVDVPASDALYVNTLRAALSSYERGDYRRAADLFQDAAAVAGYRPDAFAFAALGEALHVQLVTRTLVSRDAALPAETAASR